jgi:hypothetical protein
MMKSLAHCFRAEWAILAFCAWQSADLWAAWRHSPFDQFGWLALGIWLAPCFQPGQTGRRPLPAWLGLALAVAGKVGDLHILAHGGLACAIGALRPWSAWRGLWLALSICWMPGLGWLARNQPVGAVAGLRLALAVAAAAAGWAAARPAREAQPA